MQTLENTEFITSREADGTGLKDFQFIEVRTPLNFFNNIDIFNKFGNMENAARKDEPHTILVTQNSQTRGRRKNTKT